MLGLTSVTFRELGIREVVRVAAQGGAECIEWGADVHVPDLARARIAREICAGEGIVCNSYGSYYRLGEGGQAEFSRLCETSGELGAKTIRVWMGGKGSAETSESELEKLLDETEAIAETARGFGQCVAFEFHRRTYNDCAAAHRRFFERCTAANAASYWQPMFAGEDEENLSAALPRSKVVHMFYWNADGSVRYPLGKGGEILRPLLKAVRLSDFSGDVLIEFVRGDDPEQFLDDMAFLKKLYLGGIR